MDRERLLYLYLYYETDIFERPVKLLHVAPEPNVKTILLKKENISYLTAGLNSKSVMTMDITNISYL